MIEDIEDTRKLDRALREPACIFFKHSTRCPVSARAAEEVEAFATRRPDVPVLRVLVIEDRPVSNAVAERLGVIHESPQAILVQSGAAAWIASHSGITAETLERAWSGSGPPGEIPAR